MLRLVEINTTIYLSKYNKFYSLKSNRIIAICRSDDMQNIILQIFMKTFIIKRQPKDLLRRDRKRCYYRWMDMVDIPTQFKFEHLLSHTFPGFFSAITLFMLFDIFSPLNLTSLTFSKDLEGLISFAGFILLVGSILGIIIDGIHHSLIEDHIFDRGSLNHNVEQINAIKRYCLRRCLYPLDADAGKLEKNAEESITRHFFFKKLDGTAINQYLIEEFYSYSEFYANTSLALVPFGAILPTYITENLQIPFYKSWLIGIAIWAVAILCIYSSYTTYNRYNKALFSAIKGYIDTESTIDTIEVTRTDVKKEPTEENTIEKTPSNSGGVSKETIKKTKTTNEQTTTKKKTSYCKNTKENII